MPSLRDMLLQMLHKTLQERRLQRQKYFNRQRVLRQRRNTAIENLREWLKTLPEDASILPVFTDLVHTEDWCIDTKDIPTILANYYGSDYPLQEEYEYDYLLDYFKRFIPNVVARIVLKAPVIEIAGNLYFTPDDLRFPNGCKVVDEQYGSWCSFSWSGVDDNGDPIISITDGEIVEQ